MEIVAKGLSKLQEKLSLLIQRAGISNSALARAIGISSPQIGNYLEGASPSAGVLAAMARYFDVPMEWLANDELPVDEVPTRLAYVDDQTLMEEVARRYIASARRETQLIDEATEIDWLKVASDLVDNGPNKPVPDHLQRAVFLAANLSSRGDYIRQTRMLTLDPYLQHVLSDPSQEFRENMMPDALDDRLLVLQGNRLFERIGAYMVDVLGDDLKRRIRSFQQLERQLKQDR